jgi:hypothetical protein
MTPEQMDDLMNRLVQKLVDDGLHQHRSAAGE